ncbi:hypothetical protein COO09_10320 [Rhizorhabdus dicambivorans]|uniref:Uncharacterized protein n=1 Tax=Rhizorhabdus dicambivorans TaxID=1850238 RepID=A0A2A4FXA9_9SPHN|nr:hypothetical protein COO09_10320 [Rhizorhabdus dicambivorans]
MKRGQGLRDDAERAQYIRHLSADRGDDRRDRDHHDSREQREGKKLEHRLFPLSSVLGADGMI